MAQIFAHATAFEMINDPGAYGLSHEIVMDIKQSAVASMRVVRNSYEQYVSSGKRFCSWNQPNTPTDETFGAFMTVAYEFFVHAERSGGGYRTRVKRMMKLLQVFNDDLRQRYSQFNDTPEAGAFRATLMVAALSYAFSRDLRTEFRGLSFPINNETYTELYNLAHSR
jgi:hypothetical protein